MMLPDFVAEFSWTTWLVLYCVTALAACAHTVTGLGGAFLLLAGYSLFWPPKVVVVMVAPVMAFTNSLRLIKLKGHVHWQIWSCFTLGCIVGAGIGSYLFTLLPSLIIKRALGAMLLLYVAIQLFDIKLPLKLRPQGFITVGLGVGFISATAGAAGVIMGAFLYSFGLVTLPFAATAIASQLVTHAVKTVGYLSFQAMEIGDVIFALALSISVYPAIYFGHLVADRVSKRAFGMLVIVILFLSGVRMLFF